MTPHGYPETFEEYAKYLNLTPEEYRRILYWSINFLNDNIPEDAVLAGSYTNIPANGVKNMIESYQAILWAQSEYFTQDRKVSLPGPWVELDMETNTFKVLKEPPGYLKERVANDGTFIK
jgi:hypothetical protein